MKYLVLIAMVALFVNDVAGLITGSFNSWIVRLIALAFICFVVFVVAQIIGQN